MNDESPANRPADPAPRLEGDDGSGDQRIGAALDFLRASARRDGQSSWEAASAWQEARLEEWAAGLGLLLNPAEFADRLVRGGQEHDVIPGPERYFKVTRSGVFGLSPGIELELVPSGMDGRRFHLWEATPHQYLERLRLQNLLTPGLNRLEGVLAQPDDLAICISQPRFDLIAVTQPEIDDWFVAQGFRIVTSAAYYREEDNLGVFDAHDKNVVRSATNPDDLIPFDVIPVQPDGGFLQFIEDTLAAGQTLRAERITHTTSRVLS
ncbi:MAG: hypothetical protein ACI8UO_006663 [Verrucomicrobiales bacterium]|jgi:hypothetical protein